MSSGKDLQFKPYALSDIKVIELLIRFRYKYDENLYLGVDTTGSSTINEEVITTFIDLDNLIKQCNLNETQLKMIKMISDGYEQNEIARELQLKEQAIEGRLQTIFKRIQQQNEWNWRKYIYKNKLDLKTKECSKCKEELPATVEFFSPDDSITDGFKYICKGCR